MAFEIKRAERTQSKLKIGITGPAGSGKTYGALLVAHGLVGNWEKILVIDTENGSGQLYSHLGTYSVITLGAPFSPERYIEAIKVAVDGGFEVIIIDSISHEWDGVGGILEEADRMGNNITKWAKLSPRHRKLIETIVQSPVNVITTTRRKQEWAISGGGDAGKNKVEKLGLKEVQREGFEYELTINFDVDMTHYANVSKDRTGLFAGRPDFQLNEKIGEEIRAWSASGKVNPMDIKRAIMRELTRLNIPSAKDPGIVNGAIKNNTGLDPNVEENLGKILEILKGLKALKESGTGPDLGGGATAPVPPVAPIAPKAPESTQANESTDIEYPEDIPPQNAPVADPAIVGVAGPEVPTKEAMDIKKEPEKVNTDYILDDPGVGPWAVPTPHDLDVVRKLALAVEWVPLGDDSKLEDYLRSEMYPGLKNLAGLTKGNVREIVKKLLDKKAIEDEKTAK